MRGLEELPVANDVDDGHEADRATQRARNKRHNPIEFPFWRTIENPDGPQKFHVTQIANPAELRKAKAVSQ